jgi:hypothetical protein
MNFLFQAFTLSPWLLCHTVEKAPLAFPINALGNCRKKTNWYLRFKHRSKEEQETRLYIKWYRTIVVTWVLKDL